MSFRAEVVVFASGSLVSGTPPRVPDSERSEDLVGDAHVRYSSLAPGAPQRIEALGGGSAAFHNAMIGTLRSGHVLSCSTRLSCSNFPQSPTPSEFASFGYFLAPGEGNSTTSMSFVFYYDRATSLDLSERAESDGRAE